MHNSPRSPNFPDEISFFFFLFFFVIDTSGQLLQATNPGYNFCSPPTRTEATWHDSLQLSYDAWGTFTMDLGTVSCHMLGGAQLYTTIKFTWVLWYAQMIGIVHGILYTCRGRWVTASLKPEKMGRRKSKTSGERIKATTWLMPTKALTTLGSHVHWSEHLKSMVTALPNTTSSARVHWGIHLCSTLVEDDPCENKTDGFWK